MRQPRQLLVEGQPSEMTRAANRPPCMLQHNRTDPDCVSCKRIEMAVVLVFGIKSNLELKITVMQIL